MQALGEIDLDADNANDVEPNYSTTKVSSGHNRRVSPGPTSLEMRPPSHEDAEFAEVIEEGTEMTESTMWKRRDQMFKKEIKMNMVLFEDRLLIAARQFIVELDFKDYLHLLNTDDNRPVIEMSRIKPLDGVSGKVTEIDRNFKFVNFTDIGNNKTAMILENRKTFQLRFFSSTLDDQG